MIKVVVYNGSGAPHKDRFDGIDYSFPVGEAVVIPRDAAVHIFGMGLTDKSRHLTRLGWAMTTAEMPQAQSRLDAFLFQDEPLTDEDSAEPAVAIEQPKAVPTIDPGFAGIKNRTKTILTKAA